MLFLARHELSALQLLFLLLQHLVHPIGQISCDFECPWCDTVNTVKFRVVLERIWKPQKPLFWNFCPKRIFFCTKLPFSFLVYLIHSRMQLSCLIEPNWSDTIKVGSVFRFLGVFRKTPINKFFPHFLVQRVFFCSQFWNFYWLPTKAF